MPAYGDTERLTSLVRRIIKDYHGGHVSLLKSVPNKETIIRIVLKK